MDLPSHLLLLLGGLVETRRFFEGPALDIVAAHGVSEPHRDRALAAIWTMQLLVERDWSLATREFVRRLASSTPAVDTESEEPSAALLALRVDLMEALVAAIPMSLCLPGASHTVRQTVVAWMSAHVPVAIWSRAHGEAPPPSTRWPSSRLALVTPSLSGLVRSVTRLDFCGTRSSTSRCRDEPLAGALARVLPQRHQINDLMRHVRLHSTDPLLWCTIVRFLGSTLLGLPPARTGCDESLDSASRELGAVSFARVCSAYALAFSDPGTFEIDLSTATLFFVALRMALVATVDTLPALRAALRTHLGWRTFEQRIAACSRVTSLAWFGATRDPMQCVLRAMRATRAHAGCVLQACARRPCLDVLLSAVRGVVEARLPGKSRRLGPLDSPPLGADAGDRLVAEVVARHHRGASESTLLGLLSTLCRVSPRAFEEFRASVEAAAASLRNTVHVLPQEVWLQQVLATEREWATVGGVVANPQAGAVVVCTGCDTVCSELLPVGGTALLLPARGSAAVVVDDELEVLLCPRNRGSSKTTACCSRPLAHVHLLGNRMQRRDCAVVVCVACATLTYLDPRAPHELRCSRCRALDSSKTRCEVCGLRTARSATSVRPLYDPNRPAPIRGFRLCSSCGPFFVKWVRKHGHESSLPSARELRGLADVSRVRRTLRRGF